MFEIDKRTDLLFTLLKCGKADLVLLDDIEYDFNEILYGCDSLDILNLNSLMGAVFSIGISQIEGLLEDQCEYLRVSCSDNDKKINALKKLNPWNDIKYFGNCLGTNVYFVNDEVRKLYKTYLPEALDIFERNTGFRIS